MATITTTVSPQARHSYIGISAIIRRQLSSSPKTRDSGTYYRSDFTNQPFTGIYEPGGPTEGPLRDASNIGAPRITPLALKEHLDQFVVGQGRAKQKSQRPVEVLSSACNTLHTVAETYFMQRYDVRVIR